MFSVHLDQAIFNMLIMVIFIMLCSGAVAVVMSLVTNRLQEACYRYFKNMMPSLEKYDVCDLNEIQRLYENFTNQKSKYEAFIKQSPVPLKEQHFYDYWKLMFPINYEGPIAYLRSLSLAGVMSFFVCLLISLTGLTLDASLHENANRVMWMTLCVISIHLLLLIYLLWESLLSSNRTQMNSLIRMGKGKRLRLCDISNVLINPFFAEIVQLSGRKKHNDELLLQLLNHPDAECSLSINNLLIDYFEASGQGPIQSLQSIPPHLHSRALPLICGSSRTYPLGTLEKIELRAAVMVSSKAKLRKTVRP